MLVSEMIPNTATETCNKAVLDIMGIKEPEGGVSYMVFRTQYEDKAFICCWAGGEVGEKGLNLSAVGIGALEALSRVDANTRDGIDVYGIDAESEEELKAKVEEIFSMLENNSRVCFIGDVGGKLRPWLPKAFNVLQWSEVTEPVTLVPADK